MRHLALALPFFLCLVGCSPRLISGRGTPHEYRVHYRCYGDTISAAKSEGVDYVRTVERAARGDHGALRTLCRLEHLDGTGADGHSGVLGALIELLGDEFFAQILSDETRTVKREVADHIDYEMGGGGHALGNRDFAGKYPRTNAVVFSAEERVTFLVESGRREVHGYSPHYEIAEIGLQTVKSRC